MTMWNIDDLQIADIDFGCRRRLCDLRGWSNQYRNYQPLLRRFYGALQSRCFARMDHCGGNGRKSLAPREQSFIFSCSSCCLHLISPHVPRRLLRTAGPVSFKTSVNKTARASPKSRGVKVVWKCCNSIDAAPPDTLCRIRPNTGPNNALKVKIIKLTTPVAVPPNSGGLASLI